MSRARLGKLQANWRCWATWTQAFQFWYASKRDWPWAATFHHGLADIAGRVRTRLTNGRSCC